MAPRDKWIAPSFSRGEVDRAGSLLSRNGVAADALAVGHALDVINNWRSSHSFPLNSFQSDSLESLRRAYPNYFLDTRTFVEEMNGLLS